MSLLCHPESLANLLAQLIIIPGLGQKLVYRAAVDCCSDRFQIRVAGQHQTNRMGIELPYPRQEFRARHVWHTLVGNHYLNAVLGHQIESVSG